MPYQPTDDALELLANATDASLSSLGSMRIGLGQPLAPDGSWCGMPSPGFANLKDLSPQELLANQYWLHCVKPRAGYFNVLHCSTYAVLGYAALEASICYPAHVHLAKIAYWQIGGRGWWRTFRIWMTMSGPATPTMAAPNMPCTTLQRRPTQVRYDQQP
jgi:hypothetical protein